LVTVLARSSEMDVNEHWIGQPELRAIVRLP
jgi:hypothetical protein